MSSSRRSSRAATERPRRLAACLALWLCAPAPASAEVFQSLPAHSAAGLLAGLRGEVELGPRRVAFWNGVRVELQKGHTRQSPAELFDRVQRHAADAATPGDGLDPEGQLQRAIARGHRRDGPGWSALVRLPDRVRDVASLVEGVVPSAPPDGADGDGFIAVAIQDPASGRTDVLVTHLHRESALRELFGLGAGEVPGPDIEGLPRYPGSRRALAFSEPLDSRAVHQVAYEGDGSVADHARHYRRALRDAGLRELPAVSSQEAMHLQFSGPDREVSVHVQPHPDGRGTLDLIQLRYRGNPS